MVEEEVQTQTKKSPKLGILSLVIAIICGIGLCLSIAGFITSSLGAGDMVVFLMGIFGIGLAILVLMGIAGIVLGGLSLSKKESQKGIAIAGLVLNSMILCPTLVFAGLGIYGFISMN